MNLLTLKQGDYVDDLGGLCVITGSSKAEEGGRRGESEEDVRREVGQRGATLLALKTGSGGLQKWKGMGRGFSPKASRRDHSSVTRGFSPVGPRSNF